MDRQMKTVIEAINSNLFELVDELNRVDSFVETINHLTRELDHYGHCIDLDAVFYTIRDQINGVSEQINQNVQGLQLIAL
jgi:hypothetical protein